jgi:hypothetical protein
VIRRKNKAHNEKDALRITLAVQRATSHLFFVTLYREEPHTMKTVLVNPFSIRPGDQIRGKGHKVQRVEPCEGKPECVHIDGECYDARFSTIQKVV